MRNNTQPSREEELLILKTVSVFSKKLAENYNTLPSYIPLSQQELEDICKAAILTHFQGIYETLEVACPLLDEEVATAQLCLRPLVAKGYKHNDILNVGDRAINLYIEFVEFLNKKK